MAEGTEIDSKIQAQLHATEQIIKALSSLELADRALVISHACQLLNITAGAVQPGNLTIIPGTTNINMPTTPNTGVISNIRTLKESKSPKTDNEMACLVGYYLKELAQPEDKKPTITKEDIEKYFIQAGFELPKHSRMVLSNAKVAGYFDQVETGVYRLNPVGFNLAAYGLPSKTGTRKKSSSIKRGKAQKKDHRKN